MDSFVVYDENGVGHRVRERVMAYDYISLIHFSFSDCGLNYKQFQ